MSHYLNNCCPLCGGDNPELYFKDKNRVYLSCSDCRLVFVPREFFLSRKAEKAEYDLHTNDPADPGYQRFLSRLSRPMLERLRPGQKGLDFGCGPGPAIHELFTAHGHAVNLYDPFYANNPDVFSNTYDFITATEVVEHLHHPARVFDRLFALLHCGGWLGIMTKLVLDKGKFSHWHYIRDLTHVCFYSRATFTYIAQRHRASLSFMSNDLILLQKRGRIADF